MEQNRIKERLLKMYRLATDGVDGEKETAQRMLEANLAKYGLTMDDLIEVENKKEIYWFTVKDKYPRYCRKEKGNPTWEAYKRGKQDKKNVVCNMTDAELKKRLKTF